MKNGKWFILFNMKISGENSVGEQIDTEQKVEVELFALTESEASSQADYIVQQIKTMGHNDLKKYCAIINSEDTISFSNFQIVYKKDLTDVKIPDLFM